MMREQMHLSMNAFIHLNVINDIFFTKSKVKISAGQLFQQNIAFSETLYRDTNPICSSKFNQN